MADPPHYNTDEDTGAASDRGAPSGKSRWVSVLGFSIAIGLVLLLVVLHLTGILGPGAH
jgi:hypothetical protein